MGGVPEAAGLRGAQPTDVDPRSRHAMPESVASRSTVGRSAGRTGRPPKTSQTRDRQRIQLLDAAVTCVRREGPEATLDDIAAEAGLSKPLIYELFGDKPGLAIAVGEHMFASRTAPLLAALTAAPDPAERIGVLVESYLRFIDAEANVYRFVITQGRRGTDSFIDQPLIETMSSLLIQWSTGDNRDTEEPLHRILVPSVLGLIFVAAETWSATRPIPWQDLVQPLTDMVVAALRQTTALPH
jgi:AcrR family transcriptional regulator